MLHNNCKNSQQNIFPLCPHFLHISDASIHFIAAKWQHNSPQNTSWKFSHWCTITVRVHSCWDKFMFAIWMHAVQTFLKKKFTKYLRNLCDYISLYSCKSHIFQLLTRNGRNEIKVVRLVELIVKILTTNAQMHFTSTLLLIWLFNSNQFIYFRQLSPHKKKPMNRQQTDRLLLLTLATSSTLSFFYLTVKFSTVITGYAKGTTVYQGRHVKLQKLGFVSSAKCHSLCPC